MNKKYGVALMACVALLSACQEENWDGDNDGQNDDLSYWWADPNNNPIYLECLNSPSASSVRMIKAGNSIETGPKKTKVYHNYLNDYREHLRGAGCASSTFSTQWKREGSYRYKYVTEKYTSRFRFKILNENGFIFSAQEKQCFNNPQQSSNLVQRAIDCNFDRSNDVNGLTVSSSETYRCVTDGIGQNVSGRGGSYYGMLCSRPELVPY